MAADGLANTAIAQRLDVDVVSRWRKPFAEGGLAGWPTASAPGRPRTFTAPVVAGDGAGVRAARGERDAAGEVELPGPRDRGPGHHGVYLGAHGAPLAGAGRAQAVAAPVLDPPATRISRSRPPACSTCMSGSGRPGRWAAMRSRTTFSIIQRKLLVPDDFADLPALAAKIGGFERRYNSAALQPGQRGLVIW